MLPFHHGGTSKASRRSYLGSCSHDLTFLVTPVPPGRISRSSLDSRLDPDSPFLFVWIFVGLVGIYRSGAVIH